MTRATIQARMKSAWRKVGDLLRQGAACAHDKIAGTCCDILKREEALRTFVRVEGVSLPITRVMTVVATLKQQQRNVLDYLTEACDAANWGRPAPFLLPTALTP